MLVLDNQFNIPNTKEFLALLKFELGKALLSSSNNTGLGTLLNSKLVLEVIELTSMGCRSMAQTIPKIILEKN
jgi:hypothetical protein